MVRVLYEPVLIIGARVETQGGGWVGILVTPSGVVALIQ